jgi:hypothetical protein
MKLAIVQNWNESFGYYDVEINSAIDNQFDKYINYLKKKRFVIYSWNRDEESFEQTLFDFIHLFNYMNNIQYRVSTRITYNTLHQNKYKLSIIKEYKFALRDFCSINLHFEYFLKKCKKYYSQKLKYYKSPNSMIYRQRFGIFNFKFNNV